MPWQMTEYIWRGRFAVPNMASTGKQIVRTVHSVEETYDIHMIYDYSRTEHDLFMRSLQQHTSKSFLLTFVDGGTAALGKAVVVERGRIRAALQRLLMDDGVDRVGRHARRDHPAGNVQNLPCHPSGGAHLGDLLGSLLLDDPGQHLRPVLWDAVGGVVGFHYGGVGDGPLRTLHAGDDGAGVLEGAPAGRDERLQRAGHRRGGSESLAASAPSTRFALTATALGLALLLLVHEQRADGRRRR